MPDVPTVDANIDVVQQASDSVTQTAQQGGWGSLIWCLVALAFIYFFMVRSNKRRMAEYKQMIESIKIGDRVMAAGIYGNVKSIGDKTLEIEIAKGVVVEINKNAVAGIEK